MKKFVFALAFITVNCTATAQVELSYYLPAAQAGLPSKTTFSPVIATPKSVIGHEVGEWHITHDWLVNYMMVLDKASDRISLEVIGQTHENR
jgi:hypothetical protein